MIKELRNFLLVLSLASMLGFVYAAGSSESKTTTTQTKKSAPVKNTIFDFKDELGLSSEQIAHLHQVAQDFTAKQQLLRKNLRESETAVRNLVQKNADLKEIKAKLQESANTAVELRFAEIETRRKVESVLTADQNKKWMEIQVQALKKTQPQEKK